MAVSESKMWQYMDFCNGQIRVMAGRYGGGWLAAGCAVIEWDFDEQWADLVGGDNEYFAARNFMTEHEDIVLIECAESPIVAFQECVKDLAASIKE